MGNENGPVEKAEGTHSDVVLRLCALRPGGADVGVDRVGHAARLGFQCQARLALPGGLARRRAHGGAERVVLRVDRRRLPRVLVVRRGRCGPGGVRHCWWMRGWEGKGRSAMLFGRGRHHHRPPAARSDPSAHPTKSAVRAHVLRTTHGSHFLLIRPVTLSLLSPQSVTLHTTHGDLKVQSPIFRGTLQARLTRARQIEVFCEITPKTAEVCSVGLPTRARLKHTPDRTFSPSARADTTMAASSTAT